MRRTFAVSAFLLLLLPLVAQSPWQEAFPGASLNPDRWIAMPFGGSISVNDGVLRLTAVDGQPSPLVVTNTLLFGMTDWTFEVRTRFASTNSRNVPIDLVTVEARAGKSYTGTVAEIRNGITITVAGSNVYTQAFPDKLFHIIRLEKVGTVVAVRFDGAIVGSKDIGTSNPDTVAIGNYGKVEPGTSSADIDYIAIARASLRGDLVTHYKTGNGSIGGQDASWFVQGPGVTKTNAYIIQPNPYWAVNADALWISPYPTWQTEPKGTFTYSFGFKPPAVTVFRGYGAWLSSDGHGSIVMNGGEIASANLPDSPIPFVAPQSTMTASSTLSANVDGYGGPTGLSLVFDIHYYPKTSPPTQLTAADLTANCDVPVHLSAVLSDKTTQAPLPGRRVDFFAGPQWVGYGVTDAAGAASFDADMGLVETPVTTYSAYHESTDAYDGSIATGQLNLAPHVTAIAFPDVPVRVAETATILATVTRTDTNAPLPGVKVQWLKGTTLFDETYADGSGVAATTYTATENDFPQTQFTARFNGTACQMPATATANLNVDRGIVLLTGGPFSGRPLANATLNCNLKRSATALPLVGKTIEWLVNGVSAGTAQTDSNGNAGISFPVPQNQPLGPVPVTIRFAGDALYQPANVDTTLTVIAWPAYHGRVTLSDWYGSLAGIPISITFIGRTGQVTGSTTVVLDTNGDYSFPYPFVGVSKMIAEGPHWLGQKQSPGSGYVYNFSLTNGDANGDNKVGIADLTVVLAGMDGSGGGDLNGDGIVDGNDLFLVLVYFGLKGDHP